MTCPECGSIRILQDGVWTCSNCGAKEKVGLCAKCGERPAVAMWVGEGGVLEMTHGLYEMRCKRCCLVEQIQYARKATARLPELEAELKAIDGVHWLDREAASGSHLDGGKK